MTAIPLVAIIWEVVKKGYKQINLNFFTETAPSTLDAMLAKSNGEIIPGGIANGITGTLLMVFIASAIAIPTGIMGGIHLAEKSKSLFSHTIRFLTDLLQGTPSIVIGIIAYAWVVKPLNSYSAMAGSIALAIHDAPPDYPFYRRNAENVTGKPKGGRTSPRSLIHQCHPEGFTPFCIRWLIHRYSAGYLPGNG